MVNSITLASSSKKLTKQDIIDGFGSYTDSFMKCPVFRGIGVIAHKYYCLFQHHIPPPKASFTTATMETRQSRSFADEQSEQVPQCETFSFKQQSEDPSFIIGERPGPYIPQHSHSLYMRLGLYFPSPLFLRSGRSGASKHRLETPMLPLTG